MKKEKGKPCIRLGRSASVPSLHCVIAWRSASARAHEWPYFDDINRVFMVYASCARVHSSSLFRRSPNSHRLLDRPEPTKS